MFGEVVSGKNIDELIAEHVMKPLDSMFVQPGDDAGSISGGIRRWPVGGSFLGSIIYVSLLRMTTRGVLVPLMAIGIISTSFPSQYKRGRKFTKGHIFSG
jgi:hypothetical protein